MNTILKVSAIAIMAAALASMPVSAATVTLGNNGTTNSVNVNGNGGTAGAPLVTTSTGDTNNAAVDTGGNTTLANLFGDGISGGTTTGGVGATGPAGTNGSVLVDLFGPGAQGGDVALGSGDTNTNVNVDLFGGPAGNGGTNGGNGLNGGNGSNSGGGGGMGVRTNLAGGQSAKCFTPTMPQINKLTQRHAYDDATFSSWAGVSKLKIINIGLCKASGPGIARDANIAALQAALNQNAVIKAQLAKAGHSAGDVVAVDKSGSTLVVYVM